MREFFLGIIQGATEFLPVSSSGHLAIFSKILNIQESNLPYFVLLHLATLLSVLIFFAGDIFEILAGMFTLKKETWSFVFKIIIATIPAGLVGFLFDEKIEKIFGENRFISIFFLVTALVLFLSDRFKGEKDIKDITYLDALIIGLFQMVAILPGISRSGLTIFGALLVGLRRDVAFKFSFLMSIPVIAGSGILKISAVTFTPMTTPTLLGTFGVGLLALMILKIFTVTSNLKLFSIYLVFASILSFFVK